jgi:hypothetical protein
MWSSRIPSRYDCFRTHKKEGAPPAGSAPVGRTTDSSQRTDLHSPSAAAWRPPSTAADAAALRTRRGSGAARLIVVTSQHPAPAECLDNLLHGVACLLFVTRPGPSRRATERGSSERYVAAEIGTYMPRHVCPAAELARLLDSEHVRVCRSRTRSRPCHYWPASCVMNAEKSPTALCSTIRPFRTTSTATASRRVVLPLAGMPKNSPSVWVPSRTQWVKTVSLYAAWARIVIF